MHRFWVVFGQEVANGALHAVVREILWVVPTLALDERQSKERLVVPDGLLRLAAGPAECRRISVRAVRNAGLTGTPANVSGAQSCGWPFIL
ncbi:hypothetical protein [Haloarcula argentinensis]|uniref:Uncharacterized protein n=1 Tax=Haloarcula argentinensis TaxID=43776 RepID=A0A830FRK0_HALAR|nr:hypothetical protein [Haloarcula argentinensis]GGM29646.1 hypothetical protein GCM10009006_08980 [Haloarcula argentinensis]